jgi:hypothetical protein
LGLNKLKTLNAFIKTTDSCAKTAVCALEGNQEGVTLVVQSNASSDSKTKQACAGEYTKLRVLTYIVPVTLPFWYKCPKGE